MSTKIRFQIITKYPHGYDREQVAELLTAEILDNFERYVHIEELPDITDNELGVVIGYISLAEVVK